MEPSPISSVCLPLPTMASLDAFGLWPELWLTRPPCLDCSKIVRVRNRLHERSQYSWQERTDFGSAIGWMQFCSNLFVSSFLFTLYYTASHALFLFRCTICFSDSYDQISSAHLFCLAFLIPTFIGVNYKTSSQYRLWMHCRGQNLHYAGIGSIHSYPWTYFKMKQKFVKALVLISHNHFNVYVHKIKCA